LPAFTLLVIWIAALQALNPWIIKTFMTSDDLKGWQYGLIGGAKQWLPYWNVDTFFSQFLFGSLAALFIARFRSSNKNSSYIYDCVSVLALSAAIYIVSVRLEPGVPDSLSHQPYVAPFYAFAMALVLASAACSNVMWKILDNRLFRWIAKISFSVYLWHMVIITLIEREYVSDYVYYGITDTTRWLKISLIVVLLSTLIATLSWKFFESPILNAARERTRKK